MVELTFLGTGAAVPPRGQTNSSYLLRAGGVALLIDCGPCLLQQLEQVGRSPGELTHVFVSHRHGDHSLGHPMLRIWWKICAGPDRPLPTTIAGETTWTALAALWQQAYGDLMEAGDAAPHLTLPDAEPATTVLNDQVTLKTFPLPHSELAPVLGLRVEVGTTVLAFTSDTTASDNILPLAHGADLLVHDATYCESLQPEAAGGLHGHCTARMAGRYAAAAGVKHLVLTHLNPRYTGRLDALIDEAAAEFPGLVSLAEAGEELTY
jgi:ribonuclease Z